MFERKYGLQSIIFGIYVRLQGCQSSKKSITKESHSDVGGRDEQQEPAWNKLQKRFTLYTLLDPYLKDHPESG